MHHIAPISGVACWGDEFVATTGYDNKVILWDAATHLPIARSYHDHLANQCIFSPCGRFLASASSDYTARLWRVPDLTLAAVYSGHDDDVEMIALRADSERVATASRDRRIRVFTRDRPTRSGISSLAWSGAPGIFLAPSYDGSVYVTGPAAEREPSASRVIWPVAGRDDGDDPAAKLRAAASATGAGPEVPAGERSC